MYEHRGTLTLVHGMQFGSEGKGAIASYLALLISVGVRVGAANAGHTIYYRGEKFTMQQLPVAWVNPGARLVLGAGALLSIPILRREIAMLERRGVSIRDRLFIDHRAHVVTEEHIRREAKSDLAMRIGSTSATAGEGIGEAMAAKVLRESSCVQAKDVRSLARYRCDTVDLINTELDLGGEVLLEGTQGHGLSLEHGRFPHVTSRDTSAAALAASVGVNPAAFFLNVIGVVRSYPIRVAGRSGSFDRGSRELTWETLTRRAGAPLPIIEHTSVTKKVRRVATFSFRGFEDALQINRPTELALTFADYIDWSLHEKTKLTPKAEEFIGRLEDIARVRVTLVKTGPHTTIDFDPTRANYVRRLSTE